jgi:predicted TIM-barrel fold metal-dependent hydrolase
MKRYLLLLISPYMAIVLVTLQACTSPRPASKESPEFYSIDDFARIEKIDAHVHVQTRDPALIEQAKADDVRLFTINYDDANEPPPMELQQEIALLHRKRYPERLEYATTISIRGFNEEDWLAETLAYIDQSVANGAKAVKIYKVIGMSLRDKAGKLVMVDDPRLDTLFSFLAKRNIPVVGHLGEPRNCWLPVNQMTVNGDKSYFTQWPVYHMFLHPELPSYEQQIAARDNMLSKHQDLKFVGAHLGSLEWNVDSLAARLDRFPNMAVDMAARIVHFQVQAKDNPQKVRDFLIKYSDRLLYATDILVGENANGNDERRAAHETWINDWKFFTSDEKMQSDQFDGSFKGMKLPREAVDNIYNKNARRWLGVFNK